MRRAGFSLVELLVSTVILAVVALAWFEIMNATSPYREAQKRAAIEVATGVLDTFFPSRNPGNAEDRTYLKLGYYRISGDVGEYPFVEADGTLEQFPSRLLPSESPIRYTLRYACAVKGKGRGFNVSNENMLEASDRRAAMWEKAQKGLAEASDKGVFVIRICLFDSDKAQRPFAQFEQLVGFASTRANNTPDLAGY